MKEYYATVGQGVIDMVSSAHNILKNSDVKTVSNRHEGYGILAEAMCNLDLRMKAVSRGMKDFLASLSTDDAKAMDTVWNIDSALTDTIVAAVIMAVEARRISDDLYDPDAPGLQHTMDLTSNGFEEPEDIEDEEDEENGEDAI